MYKLSNVRNAELIKGFIIIIIIVLFFTLFWWRGGLKEQRAAVCCSSWNRTGKAGIFVIGFK